jgi:hypothetical protein
MEIGILDRVWALLDVLDSLIWELGMRNHSTYQQGFGFNSSFSLFVYRKCEERRWLRRSSSGGGGEGRTRVQKPVQWASTSIVSDLISTSSTP